MALAMKYLVPSGILTPDAGLEDEVRDLLDLPELSPEDARPPLGQNGLPSFEDILNPVTAEDAYRKLRQGDRFHMLPEIQTRAAWNPNSGKLPKSAFAYAPGDDRRDWKLPHHNPDGSVNPAGVRAAMAALGGAHTGTPMNAPGAKAHLLAHEKALGIGEGADSSRPTKVKSSLDVSKRRAAITIEDGIRIRALNEGRISRFAPRTPTERAVDWQMLNTALDDAELEIVEAYKSVRMKQLDKAVDEAMKAIVTEDVAKLESVNVPFKNESSLAISRPLLKLCRIGSGAVQAEAGRMGGTPIRLSSPLDPEADDTARSFLMARARMIASTLAERMRGSLMRAGMDMIRSGQQDRAILYAKVTVLSDATIRRESSSSVSEALSLGRLSIAAANGDSIIDVEYSAVLDGDTCDPCEADDGETFDNVEDAPATPNPDCEGRDRCRCVLIFTFGDESPSPDSEPGPSIVPDIDNPADETDEVWRVWKPGDPLPVKEEE